AAGATSRLVVNLRDGLADDKAKKVVKIIKADGPKGIQAQINGDFVRVTGKKRDDLQAVIALLKTSDFELPLQFINYR
ncbi:MAG: cyclic-di-GMP-binding protein, partial [Frankiaceae bacterium]|nr:cyclic-di-GMP-binding protein [Frankiaceae bacterium]